jgi:type IV pilus assembly protein PilN
MIRVNLLPIKQARRRSQGRVQLLLFAGVVVVEVAILATAFFIINDQLEDQQERVQELRATVSELEQDAADVEQLQQQAQVYIGQLQVLSDLEARRIGPVRMLDEMQAMLSAPRDQEDRVAQLRRDWNVEWDTRRLWVDRFSEDESGFVLDGHAGNADDVAEFLHRMNTAVYFNNVELDYVTRQSRDDQDLVQFHLFGELSYTGFDDGRSSADDS